MFGNKKSAEVKSIIVTTTDYIVNLEITNYLGVVSGSEAYKAADGIHNQDVNFDEAYQKAVSRAMRRAVNNFNADAIVGLTTTITHTGVLQEVLVTVQGTCVSLN